MITSKNRISRRSVLRGAGGVAIGLPFLEAMLLPGAEPRGRNHPACVSSSSIRRAARCSTSGGPPAPRPLSRWAT